jgi:hypothetical protein
MLAPLDGSGTRIVLVFVIVVLGGVVGTRSQVEPPPDLLLLALADSLDLGLALPGTGHFGDGKGVRVEKGGISVVPGGVEVCCCGCRGGAFARRGSHDEHGEEWAVVLRAVSIVACGGAVWWWVAYDVCMYVNKG